VEWDDPWHLTVNILATLVLVAAAAWVVSPAAKPVRHGWVSKLVWVLALCASTFVAGYYVPLGPLFVLREAGKVATDRSRKVSAAR